MTDAVDPDSPELGQAAIRAADGAHPARGSHQPTVGDPGAVALHGGPARWIPLTSRVGLWGVAIGLVPLAADILTSTWLWTFESVVTEVGFVVGGAGILATALLVLREVGRGLRPVKLAALAGVPLGAALMLMGAALLLETVFPPTLLMVQVFMAAIPASALLAVLVLVLLVVEFLSRMSEATEK